MKYRLVIAFVVVVTFAGYSQQKNYDFNAAVPANFSTSGVPLSLSDEHVKDGEKGLKWQVKKGTVLTARDLGISDKETGDYGASSARFFIYSKEVTNDTLVFKFYDKDGILKREGHLLLNYKGWRDYHRSYRYDYNNDKELPGFDLSKMEIIYKPEKPSATATLYLDAFTMVGDKQRCTPGPHMKLDRSHLPKKRYMTSILTDVLRSPDMEVKPANAQELLDAQKVASFYKRNIPKVSEEKVLIAKKYVEDCGIHRNPDGTITGKGMTDLNEEKTFLLVSQYCSFLAEAAITNGDTEAKEKLLLFTEYLLDQGLAEGGNFSLEISGYDHSRNFMWGFLEAMQLYPPKMKVEVIKLLKWAVAYNKIYNKEVYPNTDYMFLWAHYLPELATLAPTQDEFVRDLKCISRYFSLFSETTPGKADGMKPDGCVSHHGVPYIGYCYGYPNYSNIVYSLKGTSFRITPKGYQNIKKAFKTMFLQSSKGAFIANSSSGRKMFVELELTPKSLERLVEVGGDIEGKPYDADLASFYNYIYKVNKFPNENKNLDGFYQFNYAQTGVLHKEDWTAVMKGFTDKMWGTEIYGDQNRYGRYQSYGALEVMYNGDRTASGLPKRGGAGWDWNVTPGATTIHLPFDQLQPKNSRSDEYQKNSFVGALSMGKYGIFAMDFAERAGNSYEPNNLKFHKSVFAFDGVLVCLGSGISSTNTINATATNLFQTVYENDNPPIYVSSDNKINDADYNQVVDTKENGAWVLNGPGTGFYVPKNGGDITVTRGKQTVPAGNSTASSNFSKGYINHGMAPANANYRFVVVPGTTPKQMENYAKQFDKEELFTVLSQTDSLHVVKWLPDNTTAYAFFEANQQVNIGVVKSISGKSLLGVKENKEELEVTINNPDLNFVENPVGEWRSSEYKVKLQLNGNWKIVDNPSNASVNNDKQSTTIEFSLIDGNSTTVKLEKK